LLAASCAAFVVVTCSLLRRRFPRRGVAKGAIIKAHLDEVEEDADANGELLTPQRTRCWWAVHLTQWLSRTVSPQGAGGGPSMADDQRLVARGSEPSAAIRGAVTRAQTLGEAYGLD
jgi:hypothetical protein